MGAEAIRNTQIEPAERLENSQGRIKRWLSWFPDTIINQVTLHPKEGPVLLPSKHAKPYSFIEGLEKVLESDLDLHDISIMKEALCEAFPCIKYSIENGEETKIFKENTLPGYVNNVAIPNAKGFRQWTIEKLPQKYAQPLGLLEEVNNSVTFADLSDLYKRENEQIIQNREEVLFSEKLDQQVILLLGLGYVASFVDLSIKPQEEFILNKFTRGVSKLLPRSEQIVLQVGFNNQDECVLTNIHRQNENGMVNAQAQSRTRGFINHDYAVRQFGKQYDQFAIFETRPKPPYSRMLKILRGRPMPLQDYLGVRFIIGDISHLNKFIRLLHENFQEWSFTEDPDTTISKETRLDAPVKYLVKHKNYPETKIEAQIDWIREKYAQQGSWIFKRYQPDGNFFAFDMRKIETILPNMFPPELFGYDWSSSQIHEELREFANKKARE